MPAECENKVSCPSSCLVGRCRVGGLSTYAEWISFFFRAKSLLIMNKKVRTDEGVARLKNCLSVFIEDALNM
jgi:hypothetical protein